MVTDKQLQKALSIRGKANANKKWEKYKTIEQRREMLKNAHEARRKKLSTPPVDL